MTAKSNLHNCPGILLISLVSLSLFCGCTMVMSSATKNLARNLSDAIKDNNDLDTVRQGSPAYLILIDSLVLDNPENPELLDTAALLYATYSEIFVEDEERALRLTEKALNYALKLCCAARENLCRMIEMKPEAFQTALDALKKEDVPMLYTLGTCWAAWISNRSGEMNAFAQIPKVEAIMEKIISLDETYMDGGAHLYLGTIATLLPPALGGRPDEARNHFEKGLELSKNRNLMINVVYARRYARMIYDRELHDRLLNEVIASKADIPGYVLMNTLAKKQALELLESADNYF